MDLTSIWERTDTDIYVYGQDTKAAKCSEWEEAILDTTYTGLKDQAWCRSNEKQLRD